MADDLIVHNRIMRRVTRFYHLRRLLRPSLAKAYFAVALLAATASLVSIVDIIANMRAAGGTKESVTYLGNALIQTELSVQLVALGFVILGAWLMRDLARMVQGMQALKAH